MKNNEEKEGDLHDSSELDISYEAAEIPKSKHGDGRGGKFRGSIWNLPPAGFSLYKRTPNDIFADVIDWILGIFKKSIDFCRVFIYNFYCKHKQHERIKIVKAKDNTKSTENTNSKPKASNWNPANWNWTAIGRGIMGLGLFFATASMILSAVIIYKATSEDLLPKVIIAPMAMYALYTLVKVFITYAKRGDK